MHNFGVEKYDVVRGREEVYLLIVDGESEFRTFCEIIDQDVNLRGELRTILTRLEMVINGHMLRKTHFRPIDLGKIPVRGYELKSHHLRVYVMHEEKTGKLIVTAGKKGSQDRDIQRFKAIAKEYSRR